MSDSVKILAFAGSAREGSYNKKLVKVAAEGAAEAGAQTTFIDLRDYPLPIFDEDLEAAEGLPDNARTLKDLFIEHQGFLIACPEYNSSITPLLKNTIDWVSRPVEGEAVLAGFKGKVAAIMSASPGGLGGLRGLVHVRAILGNIGVWVVPAQKALSNAHEAFDENDNIKDEKQARAVKDLGQTVAEMLAKLQA